MHLTSFKVRLPREIYINIRYFIHPNAEGYVVMVDHIYAYILQAIELTENSQ